MKTFIATLLFVFMMPAQVLAQSTTTDVGFVLNGIYLASDQLYVGDTIRVYARMRNYGDVDVTGAVGFYMGDTIIQNPQTISIPVNGFDEEVFIDFIVPNTDFNIAARINDTNPQDQNLSNNFTQTILLSPLFDDDKDGIENPDDNCPNDANPDQLDFDGDGVGDVCDIDNDNDGLTDDVENTLGTNPNDPDSDNDGVPDDQDAAPLDPTRTTQEVVAEPEVTPSSQQNEATTTNSNSNKENKVSEIFKGFFNFGEASAVEQGEGDSETTKLNAGLSYSQLGWNIFEFETFNSDIAPVSVSWDFADGEKSDKYSVTHVFPGAGTYKVMLQVTDENGEVTEDEVDIVITFFHLSNPVFLAFAIVLFILFLLALAAFLRLRNSYEEN